MQFTASNNIPFYKPRKIDTKQFFTRAEKIFDDCWFTNAGKNVIELESRIANLHGVEHCIAVCNATVGLQLVIKGLELSGEVITTPFTFIATAHAIMWQGLQPVFADIDPITLTISPQRIAELVTPNTTAILGVHIFGQACDTEAIQQIADKHNLKVVYDAAHGFMTSYGGKSIGNFGDAEVLSFHATKLFHTFEGGAVLTNNAELAARLRLLKNFGFNGIDKVDHLGINAKMNEMSAAFGLSLLPYMPETIEKLKYLQSQYHEHLSGLDGMTFFELSDKVNGNGQYFPVFIDTERFGLNRDQLWAYLWDNGIETRRYFYPGAHMCEPYYSCKPWFRDSLPATQRISGTILSLPCYFDLSDGELKRVCAAISYAANNRKKVLDWFNESMTSEQIAEHLLPIVLAIKKESRKLCARKG